MLQLMGSLQENIYFSMVSGDAKGENRVFSVEWVPYGYVVFAYDWE